MLGYEEGNREKVEIRSSKETKDEWRRMCAQIDPDLTQEQVMHIALSVYKAMPNAFEKKA